MGRWRIGRGEEWMEAAGRTAYGLFANASDHISAHATYRDGRDKIEDLSAGKYAHADQKQVSRKDISVIAPD